MKHKPVSRRTALRGLGTIVALPMLEAMLRSRETIVADGPPRMAFVYAPNGKHMAAWTPKKEGKDFELSCILEPLRAVQKDLLVLSGLSLRKADANGDGPGDHARAMATFLTGRQAQDRWCRPASRHLRGPGRCCRDWTCDPLWLARIGLRRGPQRRQLRSRL